MIKCVLLKIKRFKKIALSSFNLIYLRKDMLIELKNRLKYSVTID